LSEEELEKAEQMLREGKDPRPWHSEEAIKRNWEWFLDMLEGFEEEVKDD